MLVPVVEDVRMTGADGQPRLDVFGFQLVDADELSRLTPGQIVALAEPTHSDAHAP